MELPTRYPLAAGSKWAFINDVNTYFGWIGHTPSCYVRKTLINIGSMMWLSYMISPLVSSSFAVHELIATTRTTHSSPLSLRT